MPYPVQNVPVKRPTLEENKMMIALSQCEPEVPIVGMTDPLISDSEPRIVNILSDLYDREIISTIGWAKQVPGFTDLTLNDQMRLLQSTWTEILTLSLAFRSLHTGGKLVFASDFSLDEKLAKDSGSYELYQSCMQVVERLERVGLFKEEYCVLKALVLANADTRIEDFSSIKKLRDNIMSSLGDCVAVLRPANVTAHVNSLLLCLPSLRQSDLTIKRFWLGVRREGKVVMNKLFVEMLEAHFR
jgi:estrogen-related receptor ERR